MQTQYIRDGVLVRPYENAATNFLSTRYYNGRTIVDLLASPESTLRWMTVLHNEIRGAEPFTPTSAQLGELLALRNTVEAAYRSTVDGFGSTISEDLSSALYAIAIAPDVEVREGRLTATWTATPEDPHAELTAQIVTSTVAAVTGFAATLLNKCLAPRCVLYFTRYNARQHWCSNVCGNRARVARAAAGQRNQPGESVSEP